MFNKVVLVGNLTRDIELKYIQQTGSAIAKTGIAVTRKYSANGDKREETCFVDLTFWGRNAEVANQYLRKGSKVLIEGRLKFEQWQDQNGQNRSRHSIDVDSMEMLNSKDDGNSSAQQRNDGYKQQNTQQRQQRPAQEYKEDIPDIDVDADTTEIPF